MSAVTFSFPFVPTEWEGHYGHLLVRGPGCSSINRAVPRDNYSGPNIEVLKLHQPKPKTKLCVRNKRIGSSGPEFAVLF